MFRRIVSKTRHAPAAPIALPRWPSELVLSLDPRVNRCDLTPLVRAGDRVAAGGTVAEGAWQTIHAPLCGTVREITDTWIKMDCDAEQPPPPCAPMTLSDKSELPAFVRDMGLAGMGGGMFPYGRRMPKAVGLPLHTLVVNAVECEPGIQIDASLMLHQGTFVFESVKKLSDLMGIRRRVLAVRRSTRAWLEPAVPDGLFEWLEMPDTYPGGAGKLIVARLSGRMPAGGTLNTDLGFLVMNVASLWAFGRRLLEGRPSVDRPLTLLAPGEPPRQVIAPLGVSARHLLEAFGITMNEGQTLVAEGRMMGRAARPDFRVEKGTNALMVLPKEKRWLREESPCILCGSCFDACPLKLHPIGMANRLRERRRGKALEAQLRECFLCGACSAVCPADIPLAQYFREGKSWIKKSD